MFVESKTKQKKMNQDCFINKVTTNLNVISEDDVHLSRGQKFTNIVY